MLQEYGLTQITNVSSTKRILGLEASEGVITWMRGQYDAYEIRTGIQVTQEQADGWISSSPLISGGTVVFSERPALERPAPSHLGIWRPLEGQPVRYIEDNIGLTHVTVGGAFDGQHLLVEYYADFQDAAGVASINVSTGDARIMFESAPIDRSWTYGSRQVGRTLANDSAYLTFLDAPGTPGSTILEYNLSTGENRTLAQFAGLDATWLDGEGKYLVATDVQGSQRIVAFNLPRNEAWDLPTHGADTLQPRVGGDWCIFLDFGSDRWDGGIAGIHLPTNTWHPLVPAGNDFDFVDWDTDGDHLVVQLLAGGHDIQFDESNQLYLMALPEQ